MTIWRMRIACWIPKVTNTYSEYVILIAFPLQQWLHERVSLLRCTYIACIVITAKPFQNRKQTKASLELTIYKLREPQWLLSFK